MASQSFSGGRDILGEETRDLAETLGGRLRALRGRLAVGESCTGGLFSAAITSVAGSSDYFLGGVVAYQNEAKTALLDVPETLIASQGAVSAAVALAMAEGARRRFGADVGVGITGIAGPGGGTPEKPVGTVWVAVCMAPVAGRFPASPEVPGRESAQDSVRIPYRLLLPGDRRQVREEAIIRSLRLLVDLLGRAS